MCTESSIKTADRNDKDRIKEIIDLSFPRFFRFFASRSVNFGEGKVIVAETQGIISGFVKLLEFQVGSRKYGCIHWMAVYPADRRRGLGWNLINSGVGFLKNDAAQAIFASTQRRNAGAKATLEKAGFKRVSFSGLWRVFSWSVFNFYSKIWYAPGDIVYMLTF